MRTPFFNFKMNQNHILLESFFLNSILGLSRSLPKILASLHLTIVLIPGSHFVLIIVDCGIVVKVMFQNCLD